MFNSIMLVGRIVRQPKLIEEMNINVVILL